MRLGQLRLREVRQQTTVPAVTVHDQYFLATVASHLVGGFLKQRQLQIAAIGDGSGLMTRFENLSEIIFGKHYGILLPGGVQGCVTHVEQIGPQGQVWSMFFQDAERQNAGTLRLFDCFDEVCAGEFFPVSREFGLRRACLRRRGLCREQARAEKQETKYVGPHVAVFPSWVQKSAY